MSKVGQDMVFGGETVGLHFGFSVKAQCRVLIRIFPVDVPLL
jgi:hypothetical protein